MKDILLSQSGDLQISESGDISITDSVRQAIRIRLQWFLNEWRFWPETGVPYYEDILVKKPNLDKVRSIVRSEVMSVTEVLDAKNISVSVDVQTRRAAIALYVVTTEDAFREEVMVYA